jgi:hypothetical protein
VNRRKRGNRKAGLFEYQVLPPLPLGAHKPLSSKPSKQACRALAQELAGIYDKLTLLGCEPSVDFVQFTCWLGEQ